MTPEMRALKIFHSHYGCLDKADHIIVLGYTNFGVSTDTRLAGFWQRPVFVNKLSSLQ